MIKVGLTGGYATGKSFVAAELERLGCHVIYADKLGHSVLEPGGAAYQPAIDLFGPSIVKPDGFIDRKRLAEIVFPSPDLLGQLTGIVHPAVFRREEELLRGFAEQDPQGIAVMEAAILIEANRHRVFDRLIVTVCSQETQIVRGMARDGLTREQVLARLEKQLPSAEKRRYADYVINTGTRRAETVKKVRKVYRELKQLAEKNQA